MRYVAIIALAAGLQISTSQADALMSPAVKAHLCGLAKRDAAITPEQIDAHDEMYVACLAEPDPEKTTHTDCEYTKRWMTNPFNPTRTLRCTTRSDGKDCPSQKSKLRRRVASAPERVEEVLHRRVTCLRLIAIGQQ